MKRRVLFVASVVKTHISAFHLPYLKWFREQGFEVHVCARNDYGVPDCNIDGCDVYHDMPFSRNPLKLKNIQAYRALKKIIEQNNYDLIHCHTPIGGVLARLAARKARKKGTKVVYTAHGFHFFKGAPVLNWLLFYPVECLLSRLTDVLITINQEDYMQAKRRAFKAGRIEYIHGVGIDLDKFSGTRSSRRVARQALGVPDDTLVLLSVGELTQRKNHAQAIHAFDKLKEQGILYLICGDGKLMNHLQGLTRKLRLQEKVRFLGFRNDTEKLYQAADIFVFPSKQEGLPVALMEAMASRLACIAVDIRGCRDLIQDGINGILVSQDDKQGLCKAILKLSSDEALRRHMGDAARNSLHPYALDSAMDELCAVYRSVMEL